jgi:hypothetical protein
MNNDLWFDFCGLKIGWHLRKHLHTGITTSNRKLQIGVKIQREDGYLWWRIFVTTDICDDRYLWWRIFVKTDICDDGYLWRRIFVMADICDDGYLWRQIFVMMDICDEGYLWWGAFLTTTYWRIFKNHGRSYCLHTIRRNKSELATRLGQAGSRLLWSRVQQRHLQCCQDEVKVFQNHIPIEHVFGVHLYDPVSKTLKLDRKNFQISVSVKQYNFN